MMGLDDEQIGGRGIEYQEGRWGESNWILFFVAHSCGPSAALIKRIGWLLQMLVLL